MGYQRARSIEESGRELPVDESPRKRGVPRYRSRHRNAGHQTARGWWLSQSNARAYLRHPVLVVRSARTNGVLLKVRHGSIHPLRPFVKSAPMIPFWMCYTMSTFLKAKMKIVIRAGGVGTRLWPKSREAKPKQFQELLGSRTMMQETWRRARKLVPAGKIFVTTVSSLGPITRKQLPQLLPQNLILEPDRKDSGPAIGLESLVLANEDPDEMVIGFASDHFIGREDVFVDLIQQGEKVLAKYPDHILCMGIRPRYAGTGFGYIKMGKQLEDLAGVQYFKVDSFKEKPDVVTAQKFYKDWHYLWNANIFMWKPGTILSLYEKFAPKMYAQLLSLKPYIGTKQFASKLAQVYPRLEKIAVEYIIVEPNKKLLVIPGDIDWSDIGDWREISKIQKGKQLHSHVSLGDEGVTVQAPKGKLVATLGLKNIAIIDTGDALLVCPLDRAPEVKHLVEKLKEDKKYHKYL